MELTLGTECKNGRKKKNPQCQIFKIWKGFKRERVCEAILRETVGKDVFGCQVELFFLRPAADAPLCPIWGYNCGWLSNQDTLQKTNGINPVLVWISKTPKEEEAHENDHERHTSLLFEGNASFQGTAMTGFLGEQWQMLLKNFNLCPSYTEAQTHLIYTLKGSVCFKQKCSSDC